MVKVRNFEVKFQFPGAQKYTFSENKELSKQIQLHLPFFFAYFQF